MTRVGFSLHDSQEKVQFLEKIFQLANTSIEVILRMLLLFFSNTSLEFGTKKLTQKLYITVQALLTAKKIELINKQKFVEAILDENTDAFVTDITILTAPKLTMPTYLLQALLLATVQ